MKVCTLPKAVIIRFECGSAIIREDHPDFLKNLVVNGRFIGEELINKIIEYIKRRINFGDNSDEAREILEALTK